MTGTLNRLRDVLRDRQIEVSADQLRALDEVDGLFDLVSDPDAEPHLVVVPGGTSLIDGQATPDSLTE
ncbi:hypothetical protein [Schumannella soli]|uniref:Uncharacterized protein n=1 Tax=Schumannella soli TaxID=2590779 RepID=A0A506XX83_9MICO|nr:hypothetical protein [Schumannella soli]TPW77514.1 hypothetical protein FJ657_02195 [Schumannella soli]